MVDLHRWAVADAYLAIAVPGQGAGLAALVDDTPLCLAIRRRLPASRSTGRGTNSALQEWRRRRGAASPVGHRLRSTRS